MRTWLLTAALLAAVPALGNPPPGPSDPAVAQWFRAQKQPGTGWMCCDIADGRPVSMRVREGHYEVLISRRAFPQTGDDAWHVVPDAHVIRGVQNIVGEPVAWWYGGVVRCFVPPVMW